MKMIKIFFLSALLCFSLVMVMPVYALAEGEEGINIINIQLNETVFQPGWQLSEDEPPLIPLRDLALSTGIQIIWEKESGLIYCFYGEKAAIVHPNLNYVYLIGKEEVAENEQEDVEISAKLAYLSVEYPNPILVREGKSYVSSDFLQYLSMQVFWDENFHSLDITLDPLVYGTEAKRLSYYYVKQLIADEVAMRLEEIPEKISSFTTSFNEKDVSRTINIKLAAAALDGVTIVKGGELSFNKTVGPRTPERGYLEAIIFVNNNQILGYGGGVCQVSSTLYNTALNAGFDIVERHQHSLPVSYLPLGSEATVVYGRKDLRIKNCLDGDVTVRCIMATNTLTIEFWQ